MVGIFKRTNLPCLSHRKYLEQNFKIPQHGLCLLLLFYKLAKLDGMRLKIDGVLILCIVVVLAKACFEKFATKILCLVPDLLPVKTPVRRIS